ncbi:protein of unknown function [Stenotrophomonas maltophilia]|nr:protein of unknown function [Stenotrophomonas maltophilia]
MALSSLRSTDGCSDNVLYIQALTP